MKIVEDAGDIKIIHPRSWILPFAAPEYVELELVSGTVIQTDGERSQMHISGGGSNGYGGIDAISSSITTTTSFWIKTSSGKEIPVKANQSVALRPGHKVWLLKVKGKDDWVLIINHTIEETQLLCKPTYLRRPVDPFPPLIIVPSIAFLFAWPDFDGNWLISTIAICVFGIGFWTMISERMDMRKAKKTVPKKMFEFARELKSRYSIS